MKRRFKFVFVVLAILVGFIALQFSPVFAQGEAFISRFDKDKDGKLSFEEFLADFNAKDKNKDGVMSGDEEPRFVKPRDANKDGILTKDEYRMSFDRNDRNKNGFLDADEAPKPPRGKKGKKK